MIVVDRLTVLHAKGLGDNSNGILPYIQQMSNMPGFEHVKFLLPNAFVPCSIILDVIGIFYVAALRWPLLELGGWSFPPGIILDTLFQGYRVC